MKDVSKQVTARVESDRSIRAALPFLMITSLLAGVALGAVLVSIPKAFTHNTNQPQEETVTNETFQNGIPLSQFNEVYNYLQDAYIGDLPEGKEIEYGLIKGLISSLDDKYTNFLTPEEAQAYLDSRVENFEGIGVTLAYDGENTYVETVLDGLPASQNGVLPGDVILEVDGEEVTGEIPQIVASKIRGERGTDVTISVYRVGDNELGEALDITMTRDTIVVDNIMWQDLGDGIIEIDISQFNGETPDAFIDNWDEVVGEINNKVPNLDGIVVDLRNNPGGYVLGVRHVLEEFLPNEAVLLGESSKGTDTVIYRDGRKGAFEDVNLVVLVNEGSASASEIFAASIQDNNRGKVIGMPTVGKGVEQIILDNFDDGSMLIMTFQKWLTPDGRSITPDNPITPDIEVDFTTEDFENGKDPQLDKALEMLKN